MQASKINNSDNSQTLYLTGLRGIAAIMVFFVHVGPINGFSQKFGPFIEALFNFGKYGVVIFFVLSALTICISIAKKPTFDAKQYLKKRVLRIVPMYYIAMLTAFLAGGYLANLRYFGVQNDLAGLLSHLTFLNLFDIRYRGSLVGVEWTIPLEFFYYLVIPFIFFYILKKKSRAFEVIAIGLLITFLSLGISSFLYPKEFIGIGNHWGIELYPFSYALGITLFFFYKKYSKYNLNLFHLALLIIGLLVFIASGLSSNDIYSVIFTSIWTFALIIVCANQSRVIKLIFENKFVIHMGNISYSFYLLHFLVLMAIPKDWGFGLAAIVIFTITLILSTGTYYVFEKSFMKLGETRAEKK